MRVNPALVAISVASCASSPYLYSITLKAPETARWSSATVLTHYSQLAVHNSSIGGTRMYDQSDVELVVQYPNGEGHTIGLASDLRNAFGIDWSQRALAEKHFQL